jgi:hypothetical protein
MEQIVGIEEVDPLGSSDAPPEVACMGRAFALSGQQAMRQARRAKYLEGHGCTVVRRCVVYQEDLKGEARHRLLSH